MKCHNPDADNLKVDLRIRSCPDRSRNILLSCTIGNSDTVEALDISGWGGVVTNFAGKEDELGAVCGHSERVSGGWNDAGNLEGKR